MKRLFLSMVLLTAVVGTALFAQTRTPVQLPATLKDAFSKPVKYTVTAPNILEVRGSVQDMGAIWLRDIPYNGQKTLVIKIRSMEVNSAGIMAKCLVLLWVTRTTEKVF